VTAKFSMTVELLVKLTIINCHLTSGFRFLEFVHKNCKYYIGSFSMLCDATYRKTSSITHTFLTKIFI